MNCQNANYQNRSSRRCIPCLSSVIGFLAVLLAFAIGLILGAVFFPVILSALAAVIVFAAIIAVIIIVLLIYWYRCGRNGSC